MRPRPRHATVHVRRTEKFRARNPLAIQGRRSRRDTNELRASSTHVRPIYLRTLQRVEFTNFLPRWPQPADVDIPGATATLTFSAGNALLALCVMCGYDVNQGRLFP